VDIDKYHWAVLSLLGFIVEFWAARWGGSVLLVFGRAFVLLVFRRFSLFAAFKEFDQRAEQRGDREPFRCRPLLGCRSLPCA
jgi:hypothetical protein